MNVVYVGGGINGILDGEPCHCSMYSNRSGKTWFSAAGKDSVGATNLPGAVPVLKYGNRVTEVDGIRFDSEKEAARLLHRY